MRAVTATATALARGPRPGTRARRRKALRNAAISRGRYWLGHLRGEGDEQLLAGPLGPAAGLGAHLAVLGRLGVGLAVGGAGRAGLGRRLDHGADDGAVPAGGAGQQAG